jgi:hypothetical protein
MAKARTISSTFLKALGCLANPMWFQGIGLIVFGVAGLIYLYLSFHEWMNAGMVFATSGTALGLIECIIAYRLDPIDGERPGKGGESRCD